MTSKMSQDAKKDEFKKYLEKAGVLELLTKSFCPPDTSMVFVHVPFPACMVVCGYLRVPVLVYALAALARAGIALASAGTPGPVQIAEVMVRIAGIIARMAECVVRIRGSWCE